MPPNRRAAAISRTLPDIASEIDRVVADVDLDRLRENARLLQQRAAPAGVMAVVKANAYGHGAPEVASALHDAGIRHFAVARLSEALELRTSGVADPILVLGAPLPNELPRYAAHDLDVTVASTGIAETLLDANYPLRVHVKVDTGMGRLGMPPEEAPAVIRHLATAPHVTLAGLWSHFAMADEPDAPITQKQLGRFHEVVEAVRDVSDLGHLHIANSSALFLFERSVTAFTPAFVRIGLTLYGLAARSEMIRDTGLRPVMRLRAPIRHVKTVASGTSISYGRTWTTERRTRIATVGAGYADGFPRALSNRAEVGINGQRYPVVGTVCMDMFMVDLGPPGTPDSDRVSVGDVVTLMGPGGPSAAELAAWAGTIPYEICCGISARVPRRYTSPFDEPA